MSKEIVFIDSKVNDYATFISDLSSDAEVYVLNDDEVGIVRFKHISNLKKLFSEN